MEHLAYERLPYMVRFAVPINKELDKFASKPTQKKFEELVTKVEKHSRLSENQDSTVKIFYGFLGMIILLLLTLIYASITSTGEPSSAEATERKYLDLAYKLFENPSQNTVESFMSTSGIAFTGTVLPKTTVNSPEKDSNVDDDERWIILLDKAVNSLDRKVMLPKMFFFLTCILAIGLMLFTAKKKLDARKSYQRVCDLLNRENQDYFCKEGYIWSIDHKLTKLVVTRTHENSSEIPSSDGESFSNLKGTGMRRCPGSDGIKGATFKTPAGGILRSEISDNEAAPQKLVKEHSQENGHENQITSDQNMMFQNAYFAHQMSRAGIHPHVQHQLPRKQNSDQTEFSDPMMDAFGHENEGLEQQRHLPQRFHLPHQGEFGVAQNLKLGSKDQQQSAPCSKQQQPTLQKDTAQPGKKGSIGTMTFSKPDCSTGITCQCKGSKVCSCGANRSEVQATQTQEQYNHPMQTGMYPGYGGGDQSQHMQAHQYMMQMHPGYYQHYYGGNHNPQYPHNGYYYGAPYGFDPSSHPAYNHQQQADQDPELGHEGQDNSDPDQDEEDEPDEGPEDSSASEAGGVSVGRSFGRPRKTRPGTGSVHGNFVTRYL